MRKIYAGLQLTQTDTENIAKDPCLSTQKLFEKLNPIHHTSNDSITSLICALKVVSLSKYITAWYESRLR